MDYHKLLFSCQKTEDSSIIDRRTVAQEDRRIWIIIKLLYSCSPVKKRKTVV